MLRPQSTATQVQIASKLKNPNHRENKFERERVMSERPNMIGTKIFPKPPIKISITNKNNIKIP